jgi:hypothetical protein
MTLSQLSYHLWTLPSRLGDMLLQNQTVGNLLTPNITINIWRLPPITRFQLDLLQLNSS